MAHNQLVDPAAAEHPSVLLPIRPKILMILTATLARRSSALAEGSGHRTSERAAAEVGFALCALAGRFRAPAFARRRHVWAFAV